MKLLYAFSSMANNNGSAFAGLNANTPYYNTLGGMAILIGRYWVAVPMLAIAGSLARKKKRFPSSQGTLPTHTLLFMFLLVGVVIVVGALTFFPALRGWPYRRTTDVMESLWRPKQNQQAVLGFSDFFVWRLRDAFIKLNPRDQIRNPVMFAVYVASLLATGLYIQALFGNGEAPANFILSITLWLWFTLLFANFAEAMAEGRGKAQASTLRKSRSDILAKKLSHASRDAHLRSGAI